MTLREGVCPLQGISSNKFIKNFFSFVFLPPKFLWVSHIQFEKVSLEQKCSAINNTSNCVFYWSVLLLVGYQEIFLWLFFIYDFRTISHFIFFFRFCNFLITEKEVISLFASVSKKVFFKFTVSRCKLNCKMDFKLQKKLQM